MRYKELFETATAGGTSAGMGATSIGDGSGFGGDPAASIYYKKKVEEEEIIEDNDDKTLIIRRPSIIPTKNAK